MLKTSDTNIENVLPFFTEHGIDLALIVPTQTGMKKSIMDATTEVRDFLKRNNIHDYSSQNQGEENKVSIPTKLVYSNHVRSTTTSLYRPKTKKGDPRIWFCQIGDFCKANNLLAMLVLNDELYVLNLSDKATINSLYKEKGFVWDIVTNIAGLSKAQSSAMELLELLIEIHKKGFIQTVIDGDTGIGMTLEHQLGIIPNASKLPDYKGIELKTSRDSQGRNSKNRSNLFSQIPDWENSCIHTAQELLNTYGYNRDGRQQLYCTVEAEKPNSQGLYFFVDDENDLLRNRAKLTNKEIKEVVLWEMSTLRNRLREKHPETFWITAKTQNINGKEHFQYDEVLYTKSPNVNLLGILISQQIITMDYTLSQKGERVRDHGYLFKIRKENLGLLFPSPQKYDLSKPHYSITKMSNY